jgi:hypothetical protein
MKRIISAAAVALALGTTAAYADVQTSFPDGYTIVEAAPAVASTQGSAVPLDIQTSFPDGYQVVDYSGMESQVSSAPAAGEAGNASPQLTSTDFPSGA